MKKDGTFALRIYPVLFMVLLTVVFISAVSSLFLSTKERVELNETLNLKRAVLYATGIDFPAGDPAGVQEVYSERVREVGESDGKPAYFEIIQGNTVTGYASFVSGAGLWGKIVAIFGFENSLDQFTGVEFLEQNETPGLGARITEEWFKEQFRGKKGPFSLVEEGTADAPGELDAITGATRTSDAVLGIANRAFTEVREAVESKGQEQ
jgi:Na+-transporting NADH:ubiquinone oxidoreductase subunit C